MRAFLRVLLTGSLIASVPLAGRAATGTGGLVGTGNNGGIFISVCGFSHRLPDDPIVRPGQPGASHSHDFFANTTTNAHSTYRSLRAGDTTCRREADTAGYWVPTLFDARRAVAPVRMSAYYTSRGKNSLSIKPFPAALRVVAGNASATGVQPRMIVTWSCGPDTDVPPSSQVPACPEGSSLRLHVRFPDCWNGTSLDHPDHQSHMAYSRKGECLEGYPVAMPGLQLNVVYPTRGGGSVTLASGPAYTAHADFFNAWDQREQARLVRECLNLGRACKQGG